MRTLFLLGILGALIVIATKRENQTAFEAVMKIGQKAQNLVSDYDHPEPVPKARDRVVEKVPPVRKKSDPFTHHSQENPTKLKENTPRKAPEPQAHKLVNANPPFSTPAPLAKENTSPEMPSWIMPKSSVLAGPDIPALPKALVEEADLRSDAAIKIATAEPPTINIGASYDLVKGYYENASRLLEEIK